MSILLDAYQSIQNMSVANKGTGTTAQPTIAGFGGSVNQAGYGESYGTDDTPYGGDTGKTTTKALTSGGNSITSSDIPNSGMSDLQKAQTYTSLGTKALSAGSYITKGLNYPTASGYLSKAAETGSALLSAYSLYKITTGDATRSDYAQVASTGSKYLLNGAGGQYISPVLSAYNIATGSKNPIDYTTATSGALTAGSEIAGLYAYGEGLAAAGGAATSAGGSAAGIASTGLGAGASAVGGMGVGYAVPALLDYAGITDKDFGNSRSLTNVGSGGAAGYVVGGPVGAVFGIAGGSLYDFMTGTPDPVAIEQEQMRNYATALQNYASTNPSYVYKASEAPTDFTSKDLLTRYTNMLGDPAEIAAADTTTYMKEKFESGTPPPVWSGTSSVKTNEDAQALENSWGLTDEQINVMLQNGTLDAYIRNYQELENQRRLQIQNYTAMNISNMMHYGPAYTYFK